MRQVLALREELVGTHDGSQSIAFAPDGDNGSGGLDGWREPTGRDDVTGVFIYHCVHGMAAVEQGQTTSDAEKGGSWS